MDSKKKKKKAKEEPAFYNDQLGENASEEYAEEYMQKGKDATTGKKQKK